MHIGANDLTSSLINPNRLAVHIVSLAEYALTGIDELNYVVIGSSIRRTRRSAKYFSDDLSLAEYNVRIGELNDALQLAIARSDFADRIRFWIHRGFSHNKSWQSKMGSDGVHLNASGLKKFANSVRTAITHSRGILRRM